MSHLHFINDLNAAPIADLLDCDWDTVPTLPGAYIILAGPGKKFIYPAGESPVFYIGHAKGVRGRLNRHRQEITHVRDVRKHCVNKPLLEFGAAFGARFSYVLAGKMKSKTLEDWLMAKFAKRFRSLPVANGAGGWTRLRELVAHM